LLALREGESYKSPNYTWFASRYPQFLYVDRIVVSQSVKAKGAGSLLYKELFSIAAITGVRQVACEIDFDPPNAASKRFHPRFGFKEVGQQLGAGGSKRVSLQMAEAG
jgi:predicted GNAT superfamily acetyltransferase